MVKPGEELPNKARDSNLKEGKEVLLVAASTADGRSRACKMDLSRNQAENRIELGQPLFIKEEGFAKSHRMISNFWLGYVSPDWANQTIDRLTQEVETETGKPIFFDERHTGKH